MKVLGVRMVLCTTQSYIVIGWILTLVINTDTVMGCTPEVFKVINRLNAFTQKDIGTGQINRLVPFIVDDNNDGNFQNFCTLYPKLRDILRTMKMNCVGGGRIHIDMFLARCGGFDYMCNEGRVEYDKHYKCIDELSLTLTSKCGMHHQALINIHTESFSMGETASSLCTMMNEYLVCSNNAISNKCGGKDAGNWYQNVIQGVFRKLVEKTSSLSCSFGGTNGLVTPTNIAIFVGVGVAVLLLLFCICWCRRAGVCSCCHDDGDDYGDVKYHSRYNKDNEKDVPRVNSPV